MAAKGKRKPRSKKNKKVVKTSPIPKEKEEEDEKDENDFDLEAMEKMLEEENIEKNNSNSNTDSDKEEEEEEKEEINNDVGEDELNDGDDVDISDGKSATEEESEDETPSDQSEKEDEEKDVVEEGFEKCSLDLRNLLAMNSHQLNKGSLYKKNQQRGESEDETTICVKGMMKANEDYLLQKASEGCSQLIAGLWNLETEKSDAGPLATLPSYFQIVTPRELPPPQQKSETKWEKFAKERGIAPKEKRSRKVWDEATQSWGYRTGYQKASNPNDPESWPIMEVKRNDNPMDDPWEKARDAKKERVDKNTINKMKNAEKGGQLDRGTSRRIMKAKLETRQKGREGGKMDMKNFSNVPAGVPLDLVDGKQRGKSLTKVALLATQTSTASMGKFDKMREGEPERRKSMSGLKKRKFESATAASVVKVEAKRHLKVLEHVISGGGKIKDRAIRRGLYAKGETGHDYDFDDGLGASTYKKKKGRAGIGKMSKVTKKMAR